MLEPWFAAPWAVFVARISAGMDEGDAASKTAASSRQSEAVVAGSSPDSPSSILCVCGHAHVNGTRGSCSSFLCDCRTFRAAHSHSSGDA